MNIWRRFKRDVRAEYDRIMLERIPVETPQLDYPAAAQQRQASVDMVVWRARGCRAHPGIGGGVHDHFAEECGRCWLLTHCDQHEQFDAECVDCRWFKNPEVLGTVAHYHSDPELQASEDELGKGQVIWRD